MLLGDGAKPLTTVVACQDSPGRSNADRLYSRPVEEFGDEFDFDARGWAFEPSSQTPTAKSAARSTKEADRLIISTASEALPRHAKLWIETCQTTCLEKENKTSTIRPQL